MPRLHLLVLTLAAVTPFAPFGCPPGGGSDAPPLERGTLEVSASGPASATVGETVTLDANSPVEGVSYAWVQTAGPGVQIGNANRKQATFQAPSLPSAQTLSFVVTVRNAADAVGRAEVAVNVQADPDHNPLYYGTNAAGGGTTPVQTGPQANAGENQVVLPGATVTLSGAESAGKSLTYQWRQISGTTVTLSDANTVTTTFVAPAFGASQENDLVFELRVTDSDSRSVTDRVKVTIRNPDLSERRVRIETTMGGFTIELDPDSAPITVENFLQYVDEGFYDGTIFHRVIPNFVVQGGGFLPGLTPKTTRDPIQNEANNGLKNLRATVAMARTDNPNSATSQFYVNLKDNDFLDFTSTNPGYAVFGTVVAGMDVVDRIATVQTETRSGFQDVPVTDVLIRTARRENTAGQ